MYDELTEVDIQKMKDEIDYRTLQLRPYSLLPRMRSMNGV